MSIAAASISSDALFDMFQLFEKQPWTRQLHEELAELWSLCTSRDQQELLRDLILSFCMLDTDKELAACTAINHQIKAWALEPHNTWVVAVADSGEVDGSSAGLQRLKNKITPFEQWHARLVSDIPSAGKKIKSEDCVVLFDDFVGTGSKMIRKQKWLLRILGDLGVKDVKIYFACFAGMEFGLNEISTTLSAPVFAAIALKRAITESLPADRVSVAAALMQQIEGELAPNYKNKKLADYSFGYQKSEALYCAANDNCPNNVFPVLWWAMRKGNKPFKTLLKRAG